MSTNLGADNISIGDEALSAGLLKCLSLLLYWTHLRPHTPSVFGETCRKQSFRNILSVQNELCQSQTTPFDQPFVLQNTFKLTECSHNYYNRISVCTNKSRYILIPPRYDIIVRGMQPVNYSFYRVAVVVEQEDDHVELVPSDIAVLTIIQCCALSGR